MKPTDLTPIEEDSSILPPTISTSNWLDPDTVKGRSDKLYRIQGYNAPEVGHIKDGRWVPGQYQGESALIPEAGRISGFTQSDIKGSDKYNRSLVDLTNPATGETLGNFAVKTGLSPVNSFTSEKAISDKTYLSAFSTLYPELAKQDPTLAAATEAKKVKRKALAQQGLPEYIPSLNARNESEFAYQKNAVGTGAQSRILERMRDIEKDLATYGTSKPYYDPETGTQLGTSESGITDSQRAMLLKEKESLANQLQYAAMAPDLYGGVNIRSKDRTMMNKSRSNLGDMYDGTFLNLYQNIAGIGQLAGDTTGWESLSKAASKSVQLNKMEKGLMPETLSFSDVANSKGAWDTITNGASYISGQLINSLPYIAAIIGGEVATGGMATPYIGAMLSTVPVSMLYAGQFYSEQPDDKKDPLLAVMTAIGSGTLDKVGLDILLGKNLFTIAGEKQAIQAMIANSAKTGVVLGEAEARSLLHTATKQQIMELTNFSKDFALKQIKSPEAIARRTADITTKASAEMITETAQQELEMLGQSGQFNTNYRYKEDYYHQLKEAAAGGFLIGGTVSGFGHATNMAGWHGTADLMALNEKMLGDSQRFQALNEQNLVNNTGGYRTVQDMARVESRETQQTNAEGFENIPVRTGFWKETVLPMITSPVSMLRQFAHTAIPSITNEDGSFKTNLAKIKAIMGGFGILPGEHAGGFRQRLLGKWSEGTDVHELAADLGVSTTEAERLVNLGIQNYWSQGITLSGDATSDKLQKWKNRVDEVNQSMIDLGIAAGIDVTSLLGGNSLFNTVKVDPAKWVSNKMQILTEMVNVGADPNSASTAIDNMVSNNKQDSSLARNYLNQYGVFNNPALKHLFKEGVFANIEQQKEQIANNIMAATYFGKNGQVLANLLRKAKANGEFVSEEEYKDTSTEVKAFYDMMNNNFHAPNENSVINKSIGWATTGSLLAYLSKAAVSSQAEAAIALLGTPGSMISKQLSTYFKSYFKEIKSDINMGASYAASRVGIDMLRSIPSVILQNKLDALVSLQQKPGLTQLEHEDIQNQVEDLTKQHFNENLITRLGYNEIGSNAAVRYDYANNNSVIQRKIMGVFARAITLRAQTDANRIAVLSIGSDIMLTQLRSLANVPVNLRDMAFSSGMGLTKEQAQSLTELQSYGLDVHGFLNQIEKMPTLNPFSSEFMSADATTVEAQHLQDNVATALANMVDQKIVNPQAFNTPKIFNDPRFKLITAMGRYMATASAVVLPRLYKQYILNGNVAMRYSAFATIGMALIAGQLVNMLKNGMSYGDDDSPYIKSSVKKAQRVIYSSGLLGQMEPLVDRISPLYDFNSKKPPLFDKVNSKGRTQEGKPLEYAYATAKEMLPQSPQITWGSNIVKGVSELANNETEKGAKSLARSMPVIGSFPIAQQEFANIFKKEGK